MKRWWTAVIVAVALLAAADAAQGQTRADSAAVLLHAADQLRLRGDAAAARALLDYIERQYAGTVAAADVGRMRAALRRMPETEGPGRTELIVWGTGYGAWLGVAIPLMLGSDSPEAYGVGFLAGAPLGFLAARSHAGRTAPTEGQTRAITFGGSWGTFQGLGWAEVLDVGSRTRRVDCPPEFPQCEPWEYEETDTESMVAAAVVGGLLGVGTGVYLGRRPITAGTAAAVSLSALWGTWFGFAGAYIAGLEEDDLLATTLVAGNAALLASALAAPRWQMTESRARLISLGGLIGGLAGVGLLLIVQPEDDKVAVAIPMATSAIGLALGVTTTRDRGPAGEAGPGGGALLRGDGRQWAFDVPQPSLRLERHQAALRPALHVPLVEARF
jgi:hypothetical protein